MLIVTHVGILDSLLRRTFGLDLSAPRCFALPNASINAFTVTAGEWALERWGDTHHLRRLETEGDT